MNKDFNFDFLKEIMDLKCPTHKTQLIISIRGAMKNYIFFQCPISNKYPIFIELVKDDFSAQLYYNCESTDDSYLGCCICVDLIDFRDPYYINNVNVIINRCGYNRDDIINFIKKIVKLNIFI